MTYFVTALTNDRAQLIVHTLQTTGANAAVMVADAWLALGYHVTTRKEA